MGVRRIEVLKAPFDFYWPKASAVTCIRQTGVMLVKDEVADAAVKAGYAIEIPQRATTPRRRATRTTHAANPGQPAGVDRANLAPADSAGSEPPVADAG